MPKKHEDWTQDESRSDTVMNLKTVHKMLPLVRGIVADAMVRHQARIALRPREEQLQRQKRVLSWEQRKLRYLLQSDIADQEQALRDCLDELRDMGVVMLDIEHGRVGFPTLVNNRAAYFSWLPGEETPSSWQFAEEDVARPIPAAWLQEVTFSGKPAV